MSSTNERDVEGGEKIDELIVLKAMQQQFERMNMVFMNFRDRMDRQDVVIARLHRDPQKRTLELHGVNDELEADLHGEELEGDDISTNANRGRIRGPRGGRRGNGDNRYYGDVNERGRWEDRPDRLDKDLSSITMKIPSFQGKADPDVYLE